MHPASRAVSIALLAVLTAHAGASRRTVPDDVKLVRDVAYGSDRRQQFDVYIPRCASNAPVLFMVHGGGWKRGDKALDAVVDNKVAYWAARCFVVVSTNYRLLPAADPVAQARDVARALRSARDKAATWGADPQKFILMGHSAGAHLVALLSSSRELKGDLRWLGSVALDSAAFDVEQLMSGPHGRLYDHAFGADPLFWRAASPYAQVAHETQPMLAVCSTRRVDACAQARRYASKAMPFGSRVHVLPKDLSHREINETLGQEGGYTEEVDQFMRAILNGRYPVR